MGTDADSDLSLVLESLAAQGTGIAAPISGTIRPVSAPPGGVELDLDATVAPQGEPAPRPSSLAASQLPLLNTGDKHGDPLVLGGMLGKGGAGFVQVAWQTSLERDVAVKRIRQRPPGKTLVDALVQEARLSGAEDFLEHRGAQRLIDAADRHREELVRVLDASGGDSAALRRSADQIAATASQARFGYEQALLQWPGNREALDGLQDVVERAITLELDRQNLAAVAPLFEVLPEPVPALKERYASLRKALKVDLDARAALSEIRSESQFEAGDWNRSIGMLINGTLWAVGVFLWGRSIEAGRISDPEMVNMWVAVFGTVTSITVIVLLRRLFLDNRVRRAFSASYLMFIFSLDLNRVAALFLDIPFQHTLMADHIVLLMFQGMLAAFVAPTLWAATGVVALGMLAGVLFPIPMMTIAAVELLLVNLICGWALRPRSAGGKFA